MGEKINWLSWLHWIKVGAWMYWFTALPDVDLPSLAANAGNYHFLPALLIGALVFAAPPLLAGIVTLLAMAPLVQLLGGGGSSIFRRSLLAEAVLAVPLALVLISLSLSDMGFAFSVLGVMGAVAAHRVMAWLYFDQTYGGVIAIESGELFQRASGLAHRAGITLARLSVIPTHSVIEPNAFATVGDGVIVTNALLNALTRREVDAVVAHELGHHKERHLRINLSQMLTGMLLAGWLVAWLIDINDHLPQWLVSWPLIPFFLLALQGLLSQRREYAADRQAVEITGDPEGTIAALGRISQITGLPIRGGRITGSILSHPFMEARVLAIARKFGVSEARALTVLKNPTEAYSNPEESQTGLLGLSITPDSARFTLRQKIAQVERLRWARLVITIAGLHLALSAICFLTTDVAMQATLAVLSVPLVLWLSIQAQAFLTKRFRSRQKKSLSSRFRLRSETAFVGIHPGSGVRVTEGFYDWDFGFLELEGDWLCYRGHQARFSVPRQEITSIDVLLGNPAWIRERRIEVAFQGEASRFRPASARGRSRSPKLGRTGCGHGQVNRGNVHSVRRRNRGRLCQLFRAWNCTPSLLSAM